ncbi:MAG: hypothetical protein JST06_10330 [Bacteroidetes bacterium]|nr:hypothetical protein [Bacteroidota bacterium]MBS1630135.1 hypothetical protein [Bacteroidota bacterium]
MNKLSICAAALLCSAALFSSFSSCKKSDDNGLSCPAGDGGNTQVVVFATRGGDTILNTAGNDTVYVKYGASQSPGTDPALYDKAFAGEQGENHIHLTRLKCGTYFLYRVSWDPLSQQRYSGTVAISFTKTSGEIDTLITLQ